MKLKFKIGDIIEKITPQISGYPESDLFLKIVGILKNPSGTPCYRVLIEPEKKTMIRHARSTHNFYKLRK